MNNKRSLTYKFVIISRQPGADGFLYSDAVIVLKKGGMARECDAREAAEKMAIANPNLEFLVMQVRSVSLSIPMGITIDVE
jgi:hypothetical protein